jgi:hypothetical protein
MREVARLGLLKKIDGKGKITLVWDSVKRDEKKLRENTDLIFIVGNLARPSTNSGCLGRRSASLIYSLLSLALLTNPAYCEPPPPPKLPGPRLPEPEAAALHEADKLPVNADLGSRPNRERTWS